MKNRNLLCLLHSYNSFQKDTVENLSNNFDKVYVIVRYKPLAELYKFIKIKGLEVHRKEYAVQESGKPTNVEVFKAPLFYLPFKIFYNFLGDYHYFIAKRVVEKYKLHFDIIHSHFTWTAGYVGARLKETYKKPLILTVHENDSWFNKECTSGNEKIYWTWKSADKLIRVNKKTIGKLACYNKNSVFLPNGYNDRIFYPMDMGLCKEKLGIGKEKKLIVSIGHLIERKGYEYLIRSLHLLKQNYGHTNFVCLIIGEGEKRNHLEKLIVDLKLSNHIKLVGSKFHNEVPIYVNAADIVVMPSLAEGTPISMLEALGCGKPFIGTDVGGIPDIIYSDKYGLLSKPKDYIKMAENLSESFAKSWDYDEIEKYGKKYTWPNVLREVLGMYNELTQNDK